MIPTYQGAVIPVLSIQPDWQSQIKWRQSYSTTITESLNCAEERQARFPRALYGLGFKTTCLSAAETAFLRTLIESQSATIVACPLWPLACRLTASVSSGATSMTVDDPTECLLVLHPDANYPLEKPVFGAYALLWESWDKWEVVELSSVTTGGAVTLSAVLVGDYTTSALLMPLSYGHVGRGNIDQITDEHGQWDCEFHETFHRLHDQSIPEDIQETFDPTLCAVLDIPLGGGNTFDCYADGDYTNTTFVPAGTGIGTMAHGDSPLLHPYGESFEDCSDGNYSGGTPEEATGLTAVYAAADLVKTNVVQLEGYGFSGYVSAISATVTVPTTTQANAKKLVLVVMRRSAVTLSGWTLVAEAQVSSYSQWVSVYMKDNAGETSITVTQATSGRMAAVVLGLNASGSISVENTALSSSSTASHPLPALVAAGDGRLGLGASTCYWAASGGAATAFTLASPWTQISPTSIAENRMLVALRSLSQGQSTAGSCPHDCASHNGGEVSVIFKSI